MQVGLRLTLELEPEQEEKAAASGSRLQSGAAGPPEQPIRRVFSPPHGLRPPALERQWETSCCHPSAPLVVNK